MKKKEKMSGPLGGIFLTHTVGLDRKATNDAIAMVQTS